MDEETAKAAQEIAKATSKGIEVAEKVGKFLTKVIGGFVGEVGEAAHDWARYFRYKNLLAIQDRVEAIHSARRLEGKSIPIPPRFAIPLIQKASEEDDPGLQELWAGLIANATDPTKQINAGRMLSDALGRLEPLDARLLRFLADKNWLMFRNVPNGGFTVERISAELQVTREEVGLSLQNLARNGLVGDEYETKFDDLDTSSFGLRMNKPETTFRPSPLGHALLKACSVED